MKPRDPKNTNRNIPSPKHSIARFWHTITKSRSQQSSLTNESEKTAASTLVRGDSVRTKSDVQEEAIIAVMGRTGAGKSTFVKMVTDSKHIHIAPKLGSSCTRHIHPVSCRNPSQDRNIVLVDTPGFDHTDRSDMQIFQLLAAWLEDLYRQGLPLSGILFLHRITDRRKPETLLYLDILRKLCGDDALSNVRLVTTQWNSLPGFPSIGVGESLEEELCEKYWKPFIANGAQAHRFHHSCDDAWDIINSLPMEPKLLQIQKELVNRNKPLLHTLAGQTVYFKTIKTLRDQITWLDGLISRVSSSPLSSEYDKTSLKEAREEELQRLETLQRLFQSSKWLDPPRPSDEMTSPSRERVESPLTLRRYLAHLQRTLRRAPVNMDSPFVKSTTPICYDS